SMPLTAFRRDSSDHVPRRATRWVAMSCSRRPCRGGGSDLSDSSRTVDINMLARRAMRAAFFALVLVAGCPDGVELGQVGGRVTMEGKPLENALVQFFPSEGGRSAQGRTDENGTYRVEYSARDSGTKVGRSKVMITTGNLEDASHRSEKIAFEFNYESNLFVD